MATDQLPGEGEAGLGLAAIRSIVGEPTLPVQRKFVDHIDAHCAAFIAHSPFLCLSTANASGEVDVTPRGDPAGFVHVLGPRTLAIPERPGNRLIISHTNLAENPGIGLIFLIPGMPEVLRVNGTAIVTDDADLLATMAVGDKVPQLAIKVTVIRAHLHCGRAIKRAHLWSPEAWPDTATLPKPSQMVKDHVALEDLTLEQIDAMVEEVYRELY